MKSFILSVILPAAVFLSIAANAQQPAKKQDSSKMKMQSAAAGDYPYTPIYSSNFTIGKKANAKMVLELYKDFENSDFSKDAWFSDTVMVLLADGKIMKGKDSAIAGFKRNRASLTSTDFVFRAVIPLTSVDRKQDWVALWGTQNFTAADSASTKGSLEFQAIWRVNKSKQIDFIHFFQAQSPAGASEETH
jgi:hypothetical protein